MNEIENNKEPCERCDQNANLWHYNNEWICGRCLVELEGEKPE